MAKVRQIWSFTPRQLLELIEKEYGLSNAQMDFLFNSDNQLKEVTVSNDFTEYIEKKYN